MRVDLERNADEILSSLRRLVSESDELLQATVGGQLSEEGRQARARLKKTVQRCRELYRRVEELGVAGARQADRIIRDHPYESVGIALGIGLLIGALAATLIRDEE